MTTIALAIHLTAALLLSLHVVDSRRNLLWLAVLFLVPFLASVCYLVAVLIPEIRFERQVRRLAAARQSLPAPRRQRQAELSYEEQPSLENRLRLAASLLEAGAAEDALTHYEECLSGPFADDPEVRLGAAQALLAVGNAERAEALLLEIGEERPCHRPDRVSELLSQASGLANRLRATTPREASTQTPQPGHARPLAVAARSY